MDGELVVIDGGGPGALQMLPSASAFSLWDADAFLQTERVARIMADSGLMPKALTHVKQGQGNNATEVPLGPEVVFARAVLIATQARALDVDPVLFAQCCAIVHGRLMYEGKLVAAMIEKRLGLKLDYEFGIWNRDHFEAVESDEKLWGVDDRLSVRVSATDRDGKPVLNLKGQPKSIAGSVAVWKTPQWGGQPTWRQRLAYRGAREWVRAFEPGIMLGIVTTDEAEEIETHGERAQLLSSAASAPMLMHDGFEDPGNAEVPPKGDPGKPAAEKPARKPRQKIVDAQRPTSTEAPTATDGAQPADSAQGASASAEPASDHSPEESSSRPARDEPTNAGGEAEERPLEDGPAASDGEGPSEPPEVETTAGYPDADEVYHLTGDGWEWDDSRNDWVRDTYKNGAPFSSSKLASGLSIYEDHRPEGGASAEAEGAEAAEEPDEIDRYIAEVEGAESWQGIKDAMKWFIPSPHFTGLDPEEQAAFRAKTWEIASQGIEGGRSGPVAGLEDHAQSPTAFRLWIEHIEDGEAIRGTLAALESSPAFGKLSPSQQDGLRRAAAGRVEKLSA